MNQPPARRRRAQHPAPGQPPAQRRRVQPPAPAQPPPPARRPPHDPDDPVARIVKFTSGDFYSTSGFKNTEFQRHLKKRADFEDHPVRAETMCSIESNMPTSRTASSLVFLRRVQYLAPANGRLRRIFEYYDKDFNKWKFWNYVGRQKAFTEVNYLNLVFNYM